MRFARVRILCAVVLFLPMVWGGYAKAQDAASSPVGRWQTIDDATGKVKSIVAIREENGTLYGKIEKVLDPEVPGPNPLCTHCEGDLKDKPENGLQILWGMKKNGEQWEGGQILDPHNGKVYRCVLAVEDGGKKLKVRGFIGFALLGRTQYWVRAD